MELNLRPIAIGSFIAVVALILLATALIGPSPERCAIDLVKNNVAGTYDMNGTILIETTGDLVESDVKDLSGIGLQARAVWDSADADNGWYVVAVRVEYKDQFIEWEELYTAGWGVNLKTGEIMALDNTARTYLGGD